MVAVSKTSNPADGWLGPYIVRNDGLDARGRGLPGLEACELRPVGDEAPRSPGCLGDYPSVGIDAHSLWSLSKKKKTEKSTEKKNCLFL